MKQSNQNGGSCHISCIQFPPHSIQLYTTLLLQIKSNISRTFMSLSICHKGENKQNTQFHCTAQPWQTQKYVDTQPFPPYVIIEPVIPKPWDWSAPTTASTLRRIFTGLQTLVAGICSHSAARALVKEWIYFKNLIPDSKTAHDHLNEASWFASELCRLLYRWISVSSCTTHSVLLSLYTLHWDDITDFCRPWESFSKRKTFMI